MHADLTSAKTPVTLDEIWTRVHYALARHPLCREVLFDVVRTPRNARGGNWTVSMNSIAPQAIWEASDIVADIQEAYDLVTEIRHSDALAA
ncbi:MAG: hypothetical protein JWQ82_1654 [Tardiphaga sp.]|nr:hypothetical protein [Tardiphaga sp.]